MRTEEAGVANAYHPNVISRCVPLPLSRKCCCGTAVDELNVKQCIQPGYQHHQDKILYGPRQPLVMIFKSCRLFDPGKVKKCNRILLPPTHFALFLFDTENVIQPLQRPLAGYQALREDIAGNNCVGMVKQA